MFGSLSVKTSVVIKDRSAVASITATLNKANSWGISYTVPSTAVAGDYLLQLTDCTGGWSSNLVGFHLYDPLPVITSITPNEWVAGVATAVEISGTGFGSATQPTLSFGSDALPFKATAPGTDTKLNGTITINPDSEPTDKALVTLTSKGSPVPGASSNFEVKISGLDRALTLGFTPETASMGVRDTQAFQANVKTLTKAGTSPAVDQAVTWVLAPGQPGTLTVDANQSNVVNYTAPASIVSPTSVTLTAISKFYGANHYTGGKGELSINLNPAIVTISPSANLTLKQGERIPFSASVTGATNKKVDWAVTDNNGTFFPGFLSGLGTPELAFTAPYNGGTYFVKASSNADPIHSASTKVTIQDVSVGVTPATTKASPLAVSQGGTVVLTASAIGTTRPDTDLTWLAGEEGAIIAPQKGKSITFTAPRRSGVYTIDTNFSGSASAPTKTYIYVKPAAIKTTPSGFTNITHGETVTFNAQLTDTNAPVTWTAENTATHLPANEFLIVSQDKLTAQFTAPTNSAAAATYRVTASIDSDGTTSASGLITVQQALLSITPVADPPNGTIVHSSQELAFASQLIGVKAPENCLIQWQASAGLDSPSTTISSSGKFTAPENRTNHNLTYLVTATAPQYGISSQPSQVTVPPVALTLSPANKSLFAGDYVDINPSLTPTANREITWTVQDTSIPSAKQMAPTSYRFTAPNAPGAYTVIATSSANGTSASSKILVDTASVAIYDANPQAPLQTLHLRQGEQKQLRALVSKSGPATDLSLIGDVNWAPTTNVNESGVFTAGRSAGTVSVTATAKDPSARGAAATLSVIVDDVTIDLFQAENDQTTVLEQGAVKLIARVRGIASATSAATPDWQTRVVSGSSPSGTIIPGSAEAISDGNGFTYTATFIAPARAGAHTIVFNAYGKTITLPYNISVIKPEVTVTPSTVTINEYAQIQFSSSVINTNNKDVIWTSSDGNMSPSGLFTAPGRTGTVIAEAKSVIDDSASGTSRITVSGVAVVPTNSHVYLFQGASAQLTANVINTYDGTAAKYPTLSWTGPQITTSGVFSAGTGTTASNTFRVIATSTQDTTASSVVDVTVYPVAVTLRQTATTAKPYGPVHLVPWVTGASNQAVTWSSGGGTLIIDSGEENYPDGLGASWYAARKGRYTVTVTSVSDPSKSATVTITVQ